MMGCRKRRLSLPVLVFLTIYACFCSHHFSCATDTIRLGESISFSETIVSTGGNFELGFFAPGNSGNYYVGIWYKKVSTKTAVWIANREIPITGSSSSTATLILNKEGNLVILKEKLAYMVTNMSAAAGATVATLLDSGNLVVRNNNSIVLWQSFDSPLDTLLPGMKVGLDKKTGQPWSLISWKNQENPSPGVFSLRLDGENLNQLSIMQVSERYWSTGIWDESNRIFSGIPEMRLNNIFNFSYVSNDKENYFTYSFYNTSIISRWMLDFTGQIKQLTWLESLQEWNLFWAQPRDKNLDCPICGAFGICNPKTLPLCECLQGFEPLSSQDWNLGDSSGGCVRRTPLQCGDKGGFLPMFNMKLPVNSQYSEIGSRNAKLCKLACLDDCSCTAYSYGNDSCSIWNGDLLELQQLYVDHDSNNRTELYVKLASSEFPNSGGNKKWERVTITVLISLLMLISISLMCYLWRRRLKRKGEKETGMDLLSFDFDTNSNESTSTTLLEKGREKDTEFPLFSFASVSAATDNFSQANKLGEGGFGPVYKGKLLMGQKVAVKRLSKRSGQGLEEFKNETILVARLQHKNLVRILGCCTEHDEKILIYEYMPNKSLDSLLFDATQRLLLDWKTRVRIIEGIAQGILYLHQYSRIRIIHRDLKASNILLDSDLNPKISDFGMARIFGGNDSQAKKTSRIVGTYGYMSPEYAMGGRFSIKSDVFSFGVLMLEVLSGKRNTDLYLTDSLNLIRYAWELWESGKGLELMDPLLIDPSSKPGQLRYIHVALLCVQENAVDRPTMSDVIVMLTKELTDIPSPKQLAYSTQRSLMDVNPHKNRPHICSLNVITMTTMEAR